MASYDENGSIDFECEAPAIFYDEVTLAKSLDVQNNVNVGNNLSIGGYFDIIGTTDSTSPFNGALIVKGGVGIHKTTNVGGDLNVYNNCSDNGLLNSNKTSGTSLMVSNNAEIQGTIAASSFISTSDERLKMNIKTNCEVESTERILRINPCSFEWKDIARGNGRIYGFIAQDVKQHIPEAVRTDDRGTLAIEYTGVISNLVSTVQLMHRRINDLEKKIEAMNRYD